MPSNPYGTVRQDYIMRTAASLLEAHYRQKPLDIRGETARPHEVSEYQDRVAKLACTQAIALYAALAVTDVF